MKSIVMQKYFIVLFSNMAYVTGVYEWHLEYWSSTIIPLDFFGGYPLEVWWLFT